MRGELTSFKRVRTPEYDLGNLSPSFYIVNRDLDATREDSRTDTQKSCRQTSRCFSGVLKHLPWVLSHNLVTPIVPDFHHD